MAIVLILVVAVLVIGAMYVMGLMKGNRGNGRGSGRSSTRGSTTRGGRRPTTSFRKTPLWQKLLPIVLLGLAVVSLLLGITGFRFDRRTSFGTAVLVIDASESMRRRDVSPTRLTAAQEAADAFLQELPEGTHVGLVTFAETATQVVPPTADREQVSAALSAIELQRETAIGDGLATGLDSVEEDWREFGERAAAVILLSDGEDTGSEVDPIDAAERAADLGVPVSTVVLSGEPVTSDQAELLQNIAEVTGGEAETATSAGELSQVYETLGVQLSSELEVSGTSSVYIFVAVVLAIAAAIVVLVSQRSD